MSRIFISHSSADNAAAIALRDFLVAEGWGDLFLDLDPERGIAAGERWERALNEAARRCEAVVFLISKAWLASRWCTNELNLARRLNKRLFGVLIEEGLTVADLPSDVTSTWQLVNLAAGRDHKQYRITLPITGEEVHVTFSLEGLSRLKNGLMRAGLAASYFDWPPEHDANRAPYRGLRPLEADDAGIFFGREGPVVEAIDRLRGLRDAAPPRLMVILGASGAGKSSFLRAGVLPRLRRNNEQFLALPVIRPERAALTGETGLLRALQGAHEAAGLKTPRAELRAAIEGGAGKLRPLLQTLVESVALEGQVKPPALVISIDQGEELFLAEALDEAKPFLALLRDLLAADGPTIIALFTIRSDNYERLQTAPELEGLPKVPFDLGPMPKGSYAEVIKGPIKRLDGTGRALKLDDGLVDALLADIEAGGGKDALPLLAFTLERLYEEYHAGGQLKVEHYDQLGRVKGSIEAAVERAFKAADKDPKIPRDRQARLALMRRGLIPWLAGIDPDTGAPRRRVARLSEIPEEARPLVEHLVEQRLLSTDLAKDTGEKTIEPAHEALLRQWGLLQGWLAEDAGLLGVMDGVKRSARDWAANGKRPGWLAHGGDRLVTAENLHGRPDLSGTLEPTDWNYIAACREAERAALAKERATVRVRQRMLVAISLLMFGIIAGLVAFINQATLKEQWFWAMKVQPHVLTAEAEAALKPGGAPFKECADCPEMMVIPAGEFTMGSPETEADRQDDEGPQHKVTIAKPFAVSKFEVTHDQWQLCAAYGGCPTAAGKGNLPAASVSWDDAQFYAAWLSKMTGKAYRLLTEGEWEYAARAGTATAYSWGDEIGNGNAVCNGCGSQWDAKQSAPVGSFKSNAFGLYDMHGNVWEWVGDCYQDTYAGAPADGSARTSSECSSRVLRGGSWIDDPQNLRSADRGRYPPGSRGSYIVGFRLARTLSPPTSITSLRLEHTGRPGLELSQSAPGSGSGAGSGGPVFGGADRGIADRWRSSPTLTRRWSRTPS